MHLILSATDLCARLSPGLFMIARWTYDDDLSTKSSFIIVEQFFIVGHGDSNRHNKAST